MPGSADDTSRMPKPEGKDLVVAGQRPAGRSGCPVCHSWRPPGAGFRGPLSGGARGGSAAGSSRAYSAAGVSGGGRWDSTGLSTSWFCSPRRGQPSHYVGGMVKRLLAALVAGTTAAALLAGCGGGDAPPAASPPSGTTTSPASASASPTPSPTTPPATSATASPTTTSRPVAMPPAAKAHTKAGAEAFVRAYFAEVNRAWTDSAVGNLASYAQSQLQELRSEPGDCNGPGGEEAALRRRRPSPSRHVTASTRDRHGPVSRDEWRRFRRSATSSTQAARWSRRIRAAVDA